MGAEQQRPASILVVDDNEQNRALAQATLEDEGYRVTLASNGEQALAAFQEGHPDCVLLDVRMPGMDGFAVCQRLRALPRGADTPVVFLTALRDIDTFDAALRSGADDYLTKPVRPTELVLRVQAALELRRLRATNGEQVDLLRRQRDDLMRLQLQKEQLTAFVVHDLKNPLGNLDLHAQLLQREGLTPRALESVRSIRDDVRALMRLILDLLDISKSEEGQLVPKRTEIDLPALVRDLFAELAVRAVDRGVTLTHSLEVERLHADLDLFRRVLGNLIDNALRYAPEGTAVLLSARAEEGAVQLRVSDQGLGIPPEMREKIFERFAQLEGGERVPRRGGRGLGLTFCRLAVEAHGGRIFIEGSASGAVFVVEVPDA